MRRFSPALLAAALWTGGCGHVGDPLAPRANVPAKITDLAAVQRGSVLWVQFLLPPRTTEGIAITSPLDLDLRVGPGMEPFDLQKWLAQAEKFSQTLRGGVAIFKMPAAQWAGKEVLVAAKAIGINGKDAGWSPFVTVPIVAPPAAPQDVKVENTAQGASVSWSGAPGVFRILRKGPGEQSYTRMTDATQAPWTDTSTEFGKHYAYLVQRIEKLPGGKEAESDPAAEAAVDTVDKFPPTAPTGLHTTLAPGSIEITWAQNTESDLAGYRVYRSVNGAPFERIAEVSQIPAYSDHAVEAGKTYRYSVSAVDQSNNESGRSTPVEVAMQ